MQGVRVFHSINDALRAGFEIADRTVNGYLARIRTPRGWALALVEVQQPSRKQTAQW